MEAEDFEKKTGYTEAQAYHRLLVIEHSLMVLERVEPSDSKSQSDVTRRIRSLRAEYTQLNHFWRKLDSVADKRFKG